MSLIRGASSPEDQHRTSQTQCHPGEDPESRGFCGGNGGRVGDQGPLDRGGLPAAHLHVTLPVLVPGQTEGIGVRPGEDAGQGERGIAPGAS